VYALPRAQNFAKFRWWNAIQVCLS